MIESRDIDPEGVSDDIEDRDISVMKADGHESARQAELESGNLDEGFLEKIWTPFRKTLGGESFAGQIGAVLKDIILPFVPSGGIINRTTDRISQTLKKRPMLKDKKWWQSKTIWSAILLIIIAILQVAGIDPSADPDITSTIFQVAYTLSGAFGLYGLRDAIGKEKEKYK